MQKPYSSVNGAGLVLVAMDSLISLLQGMKLSRSSFENGLPMADSEKDVFSLKQCPMRRRTAQAVRLSSCVFSSAWLISLGRANVPI